MKLLTYTSIWYFVCSLLLFVLAGCSFYYIAQADIQEDFIENLYLEEARIIRLAETNHVPPTSQSIAGEEVLVKDTNELFKEHLQDTVLYNSLEDEMQEYVQLSFAISVEGTNYAVVIRKPYYQSEDLIESIVTSFTIVAACIMLMLLLLNWWLSKKMWKPFHRTLQAIAMFKLQDTKELMLEKSRILEFNQLNNSALSLTNKAIKDYQNLKEFSENASHELQTPLAIARAKLELLLNQNELNANQYKLIGECQEAINRLSKLNQTLLLLSKIENDQYATDNELEISPTLKNKIDDFRELANLRSIEITSELSVSIVRIHPILADFLMNNLLSNAIRHNHEHGEVKVFIDAMKMVISNTGDKDPLPSNVLFNRFNKKQGATEGLGLGLAITWSICKECGWDIQYEMKDQMHTFTILFKNQISTELIH
jgi:signal transduction histidine kinase